MCVSSQGQGEGPTRGLICFSYKEAVKRGVTSGLCFSKAHKHMLKCFPESSSSREACQKYFPSIHVTVMLILNFPETSVKSIFSDSNSQFEGRVHNVFQQ